MELIHSKDCRLMMQEMDDDTVSLILTDPPYFIDGMGDDWNHQKLKEKTKKSGVVGSLPVGMKFDKQQGKNLQKFLYPIAKEWMRIIKPGGFVLCFSQNRLVHHSAMTIEDAGFEIRDILAWRYEGQAKAFTQQHFIRKRKISQHEKERLIEKVGSRKTPQLKPQCEMIVLAQAPREGTFVDNWDNWETGLIDVSNPYIEPEKFPGTIISASKPKERYGHLTTKPVDLLRHLIRIFSYENSLVYDPFAGSGSCGEAALLESRKFIGTEIDEAMAEIANNRIERILTDITEPRGSARISG
ncbi:MAG: site-specific DNA-methyltransferase [Gammaproteobacteria bacterium]|nr:site-specific DNA-methyltransferase [Gammaproteobacteria bacterium]